MKSYRARRNRPRTMPTWPATGRKNTRSIGVLLLLCTVVIGWAGATKVTAQIELVQTGKQKLSDTLGRGDVVVWLTPVSANIPPPKPRRFRLIQKDKQFSPHLLIVPTGSIVDFPNLDPFFHNVFSLFNGKRFDLGLYEEGSTRAVHFDHAGVSYLFCNIHPQMNAVVIALSTPYVAVATAGGAIEFPDVLPGSYELKVWAEDADAQDLERLTSHVRVGNATTDVGLIRVLRNGDTVPHKNKFGEDYNPDAAPY